MYAVRLYFRVYTLYEGYVQEGNYVTLVHEVYVQEGNYVTLSETSDEMYAAIEDNVYMDPEGPAQG